MGLISQKQGSLAVHGQQPDGQTAEI